MGSRRSLSALATAAITLAAAVGVAAGSAQPASAAVFRCLEGNQSICAKVTAINPNSSLVFHNQPNYTGGAVAGSMHMANGTWMVLTCWTTGSGDADGHGDRYWFKATEVGTDAGVRQPWGGSVDHGWVNDWYLTTGSYAQWSRYVGHC